MKMFRSALAGILPAFVLLTGLQPLARAASTLRPPMMQSWLTGDDAVNHIWQSKARLGDGFSLRQLAFEDRVAYQRAIEEVYWRHRIWPKERPNPKPSLDAVMSQATIEQKVQDYLRESESLEEEWQRPITPEQLQAEMDRMAQHSKQPEVLRELFAALGNDPFVIAECLARPVLSERLQVATVEWRKEPLESSSAPAQDQLPNVMAAANANYQLPAISDQPSECTDNWAATSTTNAPTARRFHTAVWTGTEMIVWGGIDSSGSFLNTGGRYNPSTDSWTATSTTNAPAARAFHTAVWTGSEMIVWGGASSSGYPNTGGRYNPSSDSWTATSTTNAPTGRGDHTAVWTGTEMIVWGGDDFSSFGLNTGGRYNPSTDSWTATSTINAPAARSFHTAVLAGSEMIVWGGADLRGYFNTGGRYNPNTDSWTATSTTNAPTARSTHTAVLAGSEMIVWGGAGRSYLNTGGRYNPNTDSWTATTTTQAPTARNEHTAVWTGTEMIVWGGAVLGIPGNTGGRYNPGTDSWTATDTTSAPTGRGSHTAVWTSSEMIVWGGYDLSSFGLNTGGRYCAQAGAPITLSAAKRRVQEINTVRLTWSGATSTDIDVYRDETLIVTTPNDGSYIDSTGDTGQASYTYQVCEAGHLICSNEVIVQFQQSGCIEDSWTRTTTINVPTGRYGHSTVWTGIEMIVWGGSDGSNTLNTGGKYNPSTDSWTATSTTNAPSARAFHTAVWTGSEMIVWGGADNTGGRYNPSTDSWRATSTTNAPSARSNYTAVWTDSEMIVWGGFDFITGYTDTGGKYNPSTNSWMATTTTNAPTARFVHTAVWTGSEMIVWGGFDGFTIFDTGGRYNPDTDSWIATSTTNAPTGRSGHTAVWTDSEMIVWGGSGATGGVITGGRYNPDTDSWTATSTTNAPDERDSFTAVWTGSEMIVWGGIGTDDIFNTGKRYDPSTDSWTATTTTNAPTARYRHRAVWTGSEMIVWGGIAGSYLNTGGKYCAQGGSPELTLVSAASRKKHGNAGTFDIDLPLIGTPGVECRVGNGGTFLQTIVFTFSEPVTSVSGTTTTSCGGVNSMTISGSTVTVELGHVNCDGSDITVTVSGVNGASGSVDASATMTLRTGDVNADGFVTSTDLDTIRVYLGHGLVNEDTFRYDITVDGKVNHGDTTLVKSKF